MNRQEKILIKNIKSILLLLLISISVIGCGSISDGEYAASVTLTGGSGRASIDSPCTVTVENGKATADIFWSSPNYDYMIVDGTRYEPVNTEGNSEFIIPIKLGKKMKIQADTVAMSTPHLIDYQILFEVEPSADANDGKDSADADGVVDGSDSADDGTGASGADSADIANKDVVKNAPEIPGLTYINTDQNAYADCYAIHRYEGGYAVISVYDGRNYLIVPEGKDIPADTAGAKSGASKSGNHGAKAGTPKSGTAIKDVTIIRKPVDRIYLAASSAMCQFDSLNAVDKIVLSGIERDNWYIDTAKKNMDDGKLEYGGKYSAPDYEMIVSKDIQLAVESTMILHTPKVMEKLEKLGIPVFVDRSSYESDPFGRCEWIKIYGLLADKEAEAGKAFEEQVSLAKAFEEKTPEDAEDSPEGAEDSPEGAKKSGKKIAFFSVNSKHLVYTRGGDDYFPKMVEKAGGEYLAPGDADTKGHSSYLSVSMEAFYDYAKDADILIYNSTIEDCPDSLEALKDEDAIFADFKAVKSGDVWYTDKSLYQFTDRTGNIIRDLGGIITGDAQDTEFFHRLK